MLHTRESRGAQSFTSTAMCVCVALPGLGGGGGVGGSGGGRGRPRVVGGKGDNYKNPGRKKKK